MAGNNRNFGSICEKYTTDIQKYPDVVRIHRGRGVLEIFVENRIAILIHIANYPDELEGCIAIGKTDNGDWVGDSTKAYCELYEAVTMLLDSNTEVYLTIEE